MNVLSLLLGLAAIFVFGQGAVRRALAGMGNANLYLVNGLAILCGLGAWSCTFSAALFAWGPSPATLMGKDLLLVLLGAALWPRARREVRFVQLPEVEYAPWLWRLVPWVFCVGIARVLVRSLRRPDGDWDAWAMWLLRARCLYRGGSDFAVAFDSSYTQTQYPLLWPGLVAQSWYTLGWEAPLAAPLLATLLYAGVLAVLIGTCTALAGRFAGAIAALALVATRHFNGVPASLYADLPVAAYVLAASASVLLAISLADRRPAILAGLFAGFAAWSKNEGMLHALALLSGVMLIGGLTSGQRRATLARAGWLLAGSLPIVALLCYFKWRYGGENDLTEGQTSAHWISRLSDPHRWLRVAQSFFREAVGFSSWSFFGLAIPIVVAWASFKRRWNAALAPLGAAAGITLMGFAAVYLLTPHKLEWQIESSLPRLLAQCYPTLLLLTVLLAKRIFSPTPPAKNANPES